jgi:hypothetical protein
MTARKSILTTTLVLAAAALATPVLAEGDDWRRKAIDTEQWKEKSAIEQGRYSGDLTRREYRQLVNEQQRIADLEKKAQADGYISRREFREIREAQSDAGKHIEHETKDGQVSFWRRWLYRSRY